MKINQMGIRAEIPARYTELLLCAEPEMSTSSPEPQDCNNPGWGIQKYESQDSSYSKSVQA